LLVVDASVALWACASDAGLRVFGREELVAPPLLWSEARAVLHEAAWRGALDAATARATLERLAASRIRQRTHRGLGAESWRVADEFGWAKTYDAEYVALALLFRCRLVTVDARMRRATERLGITIGPTEL